MGRQFLYKADEQDVLWVHVFNAYQTAPATMITTANSTMYNPGTTSSDRYAVEFNIINQDTSNPVVVSVAMDSSDSTTVAAPDIVYNNQTLAAAAESDWKGPFVILGTYNVNAVADTTTRAAIHLRVQKVDDGL